MANPNIKPRFTSENQPAGRGRPKGSHSPSTYLRKLMNTKVPFHNPITNKADKQPVALVIAIQLILKATQDGDLFAIREVLDRVDGKVAQKMLNEMSGAVTLMGIVKKGGKPLEFNIGS